MKTRNIGLGIKAPKKGCDDANCPFHGSLKVRGRSFTGVVVESKGYKTATLEWPRQVFIPKYERYEKRKTRIRVHNPPCINAKKNDIVKVIETRPLSKTKNFVIIQKMGEEEVILPSMDEEVLPSKKEAEEKNATTQSEDT